MPKTLLLHLPPLTVEVITDSDRLLKWIENYYSSAPLPRAGSSAESTVLPVRCLLEELGSTEQLKVQMAPSTALAGSIALCGAPCHYADGNFYSQATGNLAHAFHMDISSSIVRANLGGALLECQETFIYNFMRDVFRKFIFPLNRLTMLHGAVVQRGPHAIFLSGDKGMGKSTTAMMLLEHGFSLISDDSPTVAQQNGFSLVYSSCDELSVTENTLELLPVFRQWLGNKRMVSGKYFLRRRALPADMLNPGPVQISHLILLRRGPYSSVSVQEATRAEAIYELLKEAMLIFKYPGINRFNNALDNASSVTLEAITQLVSQSRVVSLKFNEKHGPELPQIFDNILAERK